MADLTTLQHVETLLRTAVNRVNIGDEQPDPDQNDYDISRQTIESYRDEQEANVLNRLSRFYSIPLALTSTRTVQMLRDIATRLTAYKAWLAIHPTMTSVNMPEAVKLWKSEADAMLNQIVPEGKSEPLAGRDIILDGESLLTGAGTQGTSALSFTTKLPWGGGTS